MTPDRWQRIEELYHAACARPRDEHAAFLAEACAGDEGLRREVEGLLEQPESGDGFLSGPALAEAGQLILRPALAGRSLAGYEVLSLIGAGGMGEVYRARDPRLGRDVAIKFLPAVFTSDADRLARFEREARLLASLNHPNICGIYGIEEADGLRFLVLELVEGDSLADMLSVRNGRSTGLALGIALGIARQIAEALEAAHEKGIVHRDLKPANIRITPDGVVKVLDFGLAKTVASDGSAPDLTQVPTVGSGGRVEGMLLGTAAYMSPEQARGQPLDKRSDIWAFGCVLFEMITGRAAFAGATISDTLVNILGGEADWSQVPGSTPLPVRRVLMRCLTKDSKQRLRDIGDARIDLAQADQPMPVATSPQSSSGWLPWIALMVTIAGVLLWQTPRRESDAHDPLANAVLSRVTNWEGAEEGAEISPDGKFVAFLGDRAAEFDVWVSQIGTGRFSNLTKDIAALEPPGSVVRKIGFAGDGSEIWFSPAGSARLPKMLLPLMGGTPRPFLKEGAASPAWSPTGSSLVYFDNTESADGRDAVYIAERSGVDSRQLLAPASGLHRHNPVWSVDGRWIYFVAGEEPLDEMNMDVWRVASAGGVPERLTIQHAAVNFLAPIDARTLLYVARDQDWSGPWLWALDVERRAARRLQWGVDQFTSVAASADGRRVVATVANPSASLWQVPLLDRVAGEAEAELYPLPLPTGRAVTPRFAGSLFFYLATRGTSDGLWKVEAGQASEVWRDLRGALSEPPAVSRDGQHLAIAARDGGPRRITVMTAEGTNARTIGESIAIHGAAGQSALDWSPDGRSIVVGGRDASGPGLFIVPIEQGAPRRLLEGQWANPVWSPDGRFIVYSSPSTAGQVRLLAISVNGEPVELPPLQVRAGGYRFLPNGTGLVYLPGIQALDFWLLEFASMKTRRLTSLANHGVIRTFDIRPDGTHIVFDRSRENSDVVLIDLPGR